MFPNLPTISESGVPGYEAVQMLGVFVPSKTPAPVVNRLNEEIVRAVRQPDLKARSLGSGVESVGSSAEQFAAVIARDMAKWSKLIRDAGLRAE